MTVNGRLKLQGAKSDTTTRGTTRAFSKHERYGPLEQKLGGVSSSCGKNHNLAGKFLSENLGGKRKLKRSLRVFNIV